MEDFIWLCLRIGQWGLRWRLCRLVSDTFFFNTSQLRDDFGATVANNLSSSWCFAVPDSYCCAAMDLCLYNHGFAVCTVGCRCSTRNCWMGAEERGDCE